MPGITDTAYPRLKLNPSGRELDEIYTPNLFELTWLDQHARQPVPRVGLLLLLKTFQVLKNIKLDDSFITITTGGGKNSPGPLKDRIRFVEEKLKEF